MALSGPGRVRVERGIYRQPNGIMRIARLEVEQRTSREALWAVEVGEVR